MAPRPPPPPHRPPHRRPRPRPRLLDLQARHRRLKAARAEQEALAAPPLTLPGCKLLRFLPFPSFPQSKFTLVLSRCQLQELLLTSLDVRGQI